MERAGGFLRLRRRRLARSLRRQLPPLPSGDNRRRASCPNGMLDYCGPLAQPPEEHRLLRNRGDGTFEDVTARAGHRRRSGPGARGRWRPTSTATAGSTSSSPTTAWPTTSGSTRATAPSSRTRCCSAPRSTPTAGRRRTWAWWRGISPATARSTSSSPTCCASTTPFRQ